VNLLSKFSPRRKDSHLLYTEALECMLAGDTDGAFWKLRELVKGDTNNVSAYIKLGDILREKNKSEQAVKIHQSLIFRRNLRMEVKIEIYRSLAKDYFEMKQFPRAEENAKRILRLDRKNEWAAEFLVRICEHQKRWQDASLYLKKLERIKGEPNIQNHARYIMMQGRQKEDQGEIERAKYFYLKTVKMDEKFADPHLYLGNIFQREKDLEKAVENWIKFAEKSAGSGKQIYNRLETALFELGRFGDIEEFYRKLMSADGGNTDAVSGLVNVMAARGEYDQAMTLVDEVLLRNNRSIRARLAKMKLALRKIQKDKLAAEVDEIVDLIHDGKSTPVRSS